MIADGAPAIGPATCRNGPRISSRPLIAKIVALAVEADEEGYPIIGVALLSLARVSRMDLPESACRAVLNTAVMMVDAVVAAMPRKGRAHD